jgi:hypothetical protein
MKESRISSCAPSILTGFPWFIRGKFRDCTSTRLREHFLPNLFKFMNHHTIRCHAVWILTSKIINKKEGSKRSHGRGVTTGPRGSCSMQDCSNRAGSRGVLLSSNSRSGVSSRGGGGSMVPSNYDNGHFNIRRERGPLGETDSKTGSLTRHVWCTVETIILHRN